MEKDEYIKEKSLANISDPISIDILKIIIEQIEESICKIYCRKGGNGTGFFCLIPFPNKFNLLPVLITNNHVLEKEDIKLNSKIKFTLNNDNKQFEIFIDNKRKVFTNDKFDITIIEIKKNDNLKLDKFLEIDDQIFKDNPNDIYKQISIYIIYYPSIKKPAFANGIIKVIEEDNYNIHHLCSSVPGSSGSPIINLKNNKVIGIHKGASNNNWNLGTFLKKPILEFYKEKGVITEISEISVQNINKNVNLILREYPNIALLLKLQFYILKKMKENYNINIHNKYLEKIIKVYSKMNFITLVSTKGYEDNNIINILLEKNKYKLVKEILNLKIYDDINIIEISKNMKLEDLDISFKIDDKDIYLKSLFDKLSDSNKIFDNEIENALKNSIFEYKIVHLIIVDKESNDYLK